MPAELFGIPFAALLLVSRRARTLGRQKHCYGSRATVTAPGEVPCRPHVVHVFDLDHDAIVPESLAVATLLAQNRQYGSKATYGVPRMGILVSDMSQGSGASW